MRMIYNTNILYDKYNEGEGKESKPKPKPNKDTDFFIF